MTSTDPPTGQARPGWRTVTEKPSFRSAAAKRRCIIPADGYFEWMKDPEGKKIPLPDYDSRRCLIRALSLVSLRAAPT
ncbi:SOS response-associated peptidase family protein [Prescottella equi]|uniref:SOS response-associated peptidase family protein n=1 Tax=Rhodococcus hoagii TaxID=43767 RepID=UPI0026D99683